MTSPELAVQALFRGIDRNDWDAVGAGLADEIDVDYTELFGGEPDHVTRDELVAQWRGLVPGFDVTQHFLGQLGETSPGTWECNVRAHHRLEGEEWMVAGWYVMDLDENHRLRGLVLSVSYETGDRALTERAAKNASG